MGGRKGPKSEAERQRDKIRYLENARGIKHTIDPAAAQRRINIWRQKGISLDTIAERTGVSKAQIRHIQFGTRSWIRTSTHAKIMGARFTREDVSMFPAIGIRRRLQAFAAAGFSTVTVGDMIARDRKYVNALQTGKNGKEVILRPVGAAVLEAYEKYAFTSPLDLGQSDHATAYARNSARKNRWATFECWDDDTIDDPEAIPEWTGRCGTARGWQIHRDSRIFVSETVHKSRDRGERVKLEVLCEPCNQAKLEHGRGNAPMFEWGEVDAMLEDGLTVSEIADVVGVHDVTLKRAMQKREPGSDKR